MKFDTFAMGMGRSGSMALTNIVKQHPDVNCPSTEKNELLLHLNRLDLGKPALVNFYLAHLPTVYFKSFGKLLPLLSQQRMLHLARNPCDIMTSLYNAHLYQSLGNVSSDFDRQFFENDDNYLFCSHPAISAPLSKLFKDNYCVLFEELATANIDQTAKRLFDWLGVDSTFQPKNTASLAYSNRFTFLDNVPLNISVKRNQFVLHLTRNALPPSSRKNRPNAKFVHVAKISLAGQNLSTWLGLEQIDCWIDVQRYTEVQLQSLIRWADLITSAVNSGLNSWFEEAQCIEERILERRLREIPPLAKQKLFAINKQGLQTLSKFKPQIQDIWSFQ